MKLTKHIEAHSVDENMTSLNPTEQAIMQELYHSSEGNGHDFGFTDGVNCQKLGITRRQLSGYISQLSQKGYIHVYNENFNQFTFTEKGFEHFK